MNLRHPKVIRLFGWGALITTLLLVAAGGFLAFTFFQSGEMLYCGLGAGITLASLVIGGLLTYGCFLLAGMTAESGGASAVLQTAAASGEEVDSAVTEIASADDTIAIPPAELEIGSPAPEYSDDAIPVFQAVPDESSDAGFPEESSDAGTEDFFVEDLLVVPPPITVMEDSDVTANAPVDVVDDFDSRMDLPVTIDASADIAAPESSDDVEPAPVEHSQTEAIVSAVTPTAEFDAVAEVPATAKQTPVEPATPASTTPVPAVPAVPSLTDAFPDIFKTPPATPAVPAAVVTAPVSTATPVPSVVAPAPAPAMAPAAAKAPAMLPAAKPPKPVVEARPAAELKPATFAPQVAAPEPVESLPTAAELPDMATILTPTLPAGGALPTEIPDFFLKMPTGRAVPAAKAAPPVAPIAPRQVAAPKPPVHSAPAAVRIVDSTTVGQVDDDLVTLTSIPDDWPS